MQTLLTYVGREGERELVLLERPDARGTLLLLDAPLPRSCSDDVVIVHYGLRTPAEARAVARAWALAHANRADASPHESRSRCATKERPLRSGACGTRRRRCS